MLVGLEEGSQRFGMTMKWPKRAQVLSERCKRAAETILPLARGLKDEELLEMLGGYGLHFERDSLRQWSATDGSAEEVIRRLIVHDGNRRDLPDQQLIWAWAAIQVLWQRWSPETSNFEMLDERVAEGYDRRDTAEGCKAWLSRGWRTGRSFMSAWKRSSSIRVAMIKLRR